MKAYITDNREPLKAGSEVVLKYEDGNVVRTWTYVIDEVNGCGGLSIIYKAHQRGINRYVVLKEFYPASDDVFAAKRRESDGKIVVCNRTAENGECSEDVQETLLSYFNREEELSKGAAAVRDFTGARVAQNNPGVLSVVGTYDDEKGNRYMVIDTKDGRSLSDFIKSGWESDADIGAYRNNLLPEIMEVLIKTTARLENLHGEGYLHLDLSPGNIYVSYTDGGRSVDPFIIDYGSAYNCNEPDEAETHRFTSGYFSPYEVVALAERPQARDEYRVDETSDTYSMVAILFYAALGCYYRAGMANDASWRELAQELYPEEVYGEFANRLTELLARGLSAEQNKRYRTISQAFDVPFLREALIELKSLYKSADILDSIPKDELMSYLLLDKYPLFKYFGRKDDIHLLFLGCGNFASRMILSAMSTGQMLDRRLYIHVVSKDATAYKDILLSQAPTLERYATFGDSVEERENTYVRFTFEDVDLSADGACKTVAKKYGAYCRYVVVSVGTNSLNASIAKGLAENMRELPGCENKKTIIHYHISESVIAETRRREREEKSSVKTLPFGDRLASFNKDVHVLGVKASKVDYLYTKLHDKYASREAALRKFVKNETKNVYNARSSLAAAVHIDYKLASLGLSTVDPKKNKKSPQKHNGGVAGKYVEAISNPATLARFMQLEHTRWMMFMIADGYRLATDEDHWRYSFRKVTERGESGERRSTFNDAFKCVAKKTHHCLVPCDSRGTRLPIDHGEWDKYTSAEEIDETDFDELDKASLKVHLIAKKRIDSGACNRNINCIIGKLEEQLWHIDGDGALEREFDGFKTFIEDFLRHRSLTGVFERIALMKEQFDSVCHEDSVEEYFDELKNELAIFKEFSSYRDYKSADRDIIVHLPWIKYSGDVTMIKAIAGSVVANITSPLIVEPERLIFLGKKEEPQLRSFFASHGNNTEVTFRHCTVDSLKAFEAELRSLIDEEETYIIDITDAHPFFACAATKLAEEKRNVGVVYFDLDTMGLTEIVNCPLCPIYRLNSAFTAEEAFALHGAVKKPEKGNYMPALKPHIDKLWEFYKTFADKWEMISSFFAAFAKGSSEVYINDFMPGSDDFGSDSKRMSSAVYKETGIGDIMEKLSEYGVVKDFSAKDTEGFTLIKYEYSRASGASTQPDTVKKRLDVLFGSLGNLRLSCSITKKSDGCLKIDIKSGIKVYHTFQEEKFSSADGNKEYSLSYMEEPLRWLEEKGLISQLKCSFGSAGRRVEFFYNSTAIRDCLTTAGNILEAYVWCEAEKTGAFDSVQSNFSFLWNEGSKVSNELDVIMTRGLTTFVCSCKTARYDKAHLYELKTVADSFSVNSVPVIIYSSDTMYDSGRICDTVDAVANRAKEMGIHLIDRSALWSGGLGDRLKSIAGLD